MRVAVLTGPESVEIVERPDPERLEGTVIVAIDRCGIGGTDLNSYRWGEVPAPAWFGHEWAGRVIEAGPDTPGRFVGERVVGAVPPPCGRCRPCGANLGQHCQEALALILGAHPTASDHGAFAERIRVDARRVHRVPEAVEASNAALVEPAAGAAHAVSNSGQGLGDTVVVIGAGTIGLLVAELARMAGAARLAAVDVVPERRELAASLGADAVFASGPDVQRWLRDHGHGLGADVVYECAGRPETLRQAVDLARHGGTVVLMGNSERSAELTPLDLVSKHLRLEASLGYTVSDVHRALDLMAEDRFRMSAIHARLVGFDELVETFAELASDLTAPRKVIFAPE